MSIHPHHMRTLIIAPELRRIGLWSPSAEELLMLTAAQETHGGKYLKQGWKLLHDARGVALGPFGMEAATYNDHFETYLNGKFELKRRVLGYYVAIPPATTMVHDLRFAAAMTRIHYLRSPEALPPADRPDLLAIYWDEKYNKNPDAGFPSEALHNYRRYLNNEF